MTDIILSEYGVTERSGVPVVSSRYVADKFGKSRQAIQQRREKLIKADAIRMTRNGVEIVGIDVSQTLKAEKPA